MLFEVAWRFSLCTRARIAIDLKTLQRSCDDAVGASTIHLVNAFTSEARIVLAQQKVADKLNRSLRYRAARPNRVALWLRSMPLAAKKAIADKTIDGGGYLLAVRGN